LRSFLFVAIAIAVSGCAGFDGRPVYYPVTKEQMVGVNSPCAKAWDATPDHPAHACSNAFADPLHPGAVACRIFYTVSKDHPDDVAIETHNCAGVDQALARKEGRL
jgi:hypothetical protein